MVVDPIDTNAQLVRDLGLTYRVLADPEHTAIDTYGLRHDDAGPQGAIARPATFVIDASGAVRWRSLVENYRYRPRPEEILAALDRLAAPAAQTRVP